MSDPARKLKASVVIITAGRRQCLPPCVESLRNQTYRPMEIVVVAGPSKDGSQGYASTLTDAKVCSVDKLNVAYARNEGVRQSGGDIIVFIDDDAVAHPRWLEELMQVFEREGPSCGGVGGQVINENGPGQPLQAFNNTINLLGEPDQVRLSPAETTDTARAEFTYFMGANMAFRREAILACGGFDETFFYLYEDVDMTVSVAKAGYRVFHHTRALVHHFPAVSHNRRGTLDLNYFAIVRHQTYFSMKYSTRPVVPCLWSLTLPKRHWIREFAQHVARGRMSLKAAIRYTSMIGRGLMSGLKNGMRFRREGRPTILTSELERPAFKTVAGPKVVAVRPETRHGLRIALICGEFGGPVFGGVGTYTRHLAEALTSHGHDVSLLRSGDQECRIAAEGYKVVNIPPVPDPAAYRAQFLSCLHKLSSRFEFDIVEAPLWAGEGSAIGVSGRLPVVTRLQTPFELVRRISGIEAGPAVLAMVGAEQLQLAYSAGVIGISRAVVDTVRDTYPVQLEAHGRQLTIIPLGMPGAGQLVRKPIEAPCHGGTRFLFIGRLEARKGVLELAKAFARVAEQDPKASLWVVGADNSTHDGFFTRTGSDYVHAMNALWGSGIAERVHFFGKITDEEKNFLTSECDVLVAPSVYESFGLMYLEAMRYGKPVIGTNAGGIPEVVADGLTGLLVPPESADELAMAMNQLGNNPELRRRLGKKGLSRFEESFSLYSLARQTENFYRAVLEDWHGRSFNAPRVSLPAEPIPSRSATSRRVA